MIKVIVIIGAIAGTVILLWCLKDTISGLMQEKDLSLLLQLEDNVSITDFERKRQRKVVVILILMVLWPLLAYDLMYMAFIAGSMIVIYKQPYMRLKAKQRFMITKLKYEFPLWLRQLQVLLQNHTVLQAMEFSLERSPAILRHSIAELISVVQKNPVGIQPYLDFMKEYEIYEMQKAMKLLYRYHFVGAEESYQQFHRMIEATGKWLRQARKEKKANQMAMLQWIGMVPLFGVTFMFLVMMIVVIMEMMKGGIT